MSTPDNASASGWIRFLTGPLAGQTFHIARRVTTLGRHSTNNIAIKSDMSISRQQARLVWQGGAWYIEKFPDANTLTVNQQNVEQAMLHHGDIVGLGPDSAFIFEIGPAKSAADEETLSDVPGPSLSTATIPAPEAAAQLPPTVAVSAAPLPITSEAAAPAPQQDSSEQNEPWLLPTLIESLPSLGIPSLKVSFGSSGERKVHHFNKEIINIGRDPKNEIVIDQSAVSRFHFQIIRQGRQFVFIHPHPDQPRTTNGLLYQGRKIPGDESFRKTLATGDVFRIGDQQGELITLTYDDGSGAAPDTLPKMQPIRLDTPEITIGRQPDNSVVLAHPQVSAHHARLTREGGAYRLLDLHSTNHVYVNAHLVSSHLLQLGDEIRIGPYRLVYESTHLSQ
ncbi:MAG TPA: FHA domain-containing protein, partial [Ktedonobacterales bacterium]